MNTDLTYIAIGLLIFSVISCSTKTTEDTAIDTGIIEITKEQFQSENMEFGKPELHRFENTIPFVGKIIPKVNGVAKISVPIDGIVKKIYVQPGDLVKKGEKIIEVGGNAMIDLQQEFAASSAKLKQLTAEYKRARLLYNDSIKIEDDFLKIESNYKTALGIYSALKLKLTRLGIASDDIESGQYMDNYAILAPIGGQIVNLDFDLGQFISSDEYIAEIIDSKQVQIQISIFEKDLSQIKEGHDVIFSVVGDSMKYKGKVKSIASLLNDNTQSSDCYAEILDEDKRFTINQLVNGSVITNVDTLLAIPNTALVSSDDKMYIFAKEGMLNDMYQIKKYKVTTGSIDDIYTELKGYNLSNDLLIKGTFNLNVD